MKSPPQPHRPPTHRCNQAGKSDYSPCGVRSGERFSGENIHNLNEVLRASNSESKSVMIGNCD